MKLSLKIVSGVSLLGLSSAILVGAYLRPQNTKQAKAETSADYNNPASATSADYGNYYNGITGTQGMTLKDQLTSLISGHTQVSYDGLYDLYKTSDVRPEDGTIFDMYGDFHFATGGTCGSYKNEGDCYNREHSVPQSWFNGASPMYSDAFHLYPTDGKVNGMRSNYPFGEVSSATYSYTFKNDIEGVSKRGNSKRSSYSGVVFEPADCYKGDFARSYFYFATRYMDKVGSMSGNGTVHFTSSTTYCNLTQYSKELFLDWHRNDPVSKKEVVRNNAIYAKQKNRNPFIDHPEYVEAIWGDTPIGSGSVSLSQSVLSMEYDGSGAQLTASSSDNSVITWSTSNSTVASLSTTTSNSGIAITVYPGAVGSATITATATINGVNYSSSCAVTVTKRVSSLSYTGTPTKTEYIAGDSFDPTGLTITARYTDSSEENVTDNVTWTPNPLIEGITSVTGTYSGQTITVTGITVAHNDSPIGSEYIIDATSSSQVTSNTTSEVVFTETPVTVTIQKSGSSTNANNYVAKSGQTRVYANSLITFYAGGAYITSIKVGYHSGKTLNGMKNGTWTNTSSVEQDDNLDLIVTPSANSTTVTCTPSDTSSFTGFTIELNGGGGGGSTDKTLVSISTDGETTEYTQGNVFSYDGVCTATYSDSTTAVVTPVVDSSDVNMNAPGTYTVNLSYTEGGITVDDCYDITVIEKEDSGSTFVNTIQECYSKTASSSVTNVYGLYVGSVNNGQSAIIMNGEYGIMLYNQSASGWTENETYICVSSATLDIYNNLYELKNCTCTTITNTTTINENIEPVVTYGITGSESASDLTIANRLSLLSGVVTNIEYKNKTYYDGWNSSYDNRITVNVNGHSLYLFVKKNDATSTLQTAFENSLNNSKEITVQGFTSFYTSFEIQFKELVAEDATYSAEDFAQDLLSLTNSVCNVSFNNNWSNVSASLAPIWVQLEGANYYAKLPSSQKELLRTATADENGSTIEEAMSRYDHICIRYSNLNNFINRSSANSPSNSLRQLSTNNLLILTISLFMGASGIIGAWLFLKKKKFN